MTERPIVPYGRQSIDEADIAAVVRVLRSDWLTQGPAVDEFEAALCQAFGCANAVAVSSGTAALHVAMLSLGIGPGDLVLVPSITFVASANAALYCGADVALIDVESDTALLDVQALQAFLASYDGPLRPRAVVAVHYAGLPCDMVALGRACDEHGLLLIEDASHAPGATWQDGDGTVRTIGDASSSSCAILSFHPVKHLTTAEGGAVVTRHVVVAERARRLRTHGITRDRGLMERNDGPWWYEQHDLGYNYRLPDVLAALGTSQLTKHARWLRRRREIAARYDRWLADVPGVERQASRPGREHAYHLYPVLADDRDELLAHLLAEGIRAQVHYIPVHLQPYYRKRYGAQSCPNAESWYARELSIPMYPGLSEEVIDRICAALAGAPR